MNPTKRGSHLELHPLNKKKQKNKNKVEAALGASHVCRPGRIEVHKKKTTKNSKTGFWFSQGPRKSDVEVWNPKGIQKLTPRDPPGGATLG